MAASESLPANWTRVTEDTEYDPFMDREYTSIVYEHAATGRRVYVSDVQEPNSFGGWGYLVRVNDPAHGELGLVEDVGSAKERAVEFMEVYESPDR